MRSKPFGVLLSWRKCAKTLCSHCDDDCVTYIIMQLHLVPYYTDVLYSILISNALDQCWKHFWLLCETDQTLLSEHCSNYVVSKVLLRGLAQTSTRSIQLRVTGLAALYSTSLHAAGWQLIVQRTIKIGWRLVSRGVAAFPPPPRSPLSCRHSGSGPSRHSSAWRPLLSALALTDDVRVCVCVCVSTRQCVVPKRGDPWQVGGQGRRRDRYHPAGGLGYRPVCNADHQWACQWAKQGPSQDNSVVRRISCHMGRIPLKRKLEQSRLVALSF